MKQCVGLFVADDLLRLRVPLQRATEGVGNVAEVAGGDGAVRGFRGANGLLAALHTIEEVARVTG